MRIEYTPPDDTYDEPFIWVFDGSNLVDGQDNPNQFVYVKGGWGDFEMRRVVGFGSVLKPGVGEFRLYDQNREPMQSAPRFATVGTDDMAVVPEREYLETTAIRFDLYGVQRLFN